MNVDAKRYYALLGLRPTCSDEEIRVAFRRRAKQLHPDVESGNASAFIRLKRAYDTLGDPAKRANYDRANRPRIRQGPRAFEDVPVPPRVRPHRSGGISLARYVAAFIFVGGISLAAVETMISYADAPPAGSPRPVSLLSRPAHDREVAKDDSRAGDRAAAAARTGFWDPSSPDGSPRDSGSDDRARPRPTNNGVGTFSSE